MKSVIYGYIYHRYKISKDENYKEIITGIGNSVVARMLERGFECSLKLGL